MSVYDERPWLAHYAGQPADYQIPYADGLQMFQAGLLRAPGQPAITYFDASISRRELDEMSDSLAVALLARGFRRGDRLAVYLQNMPQFVIAQVATWKAGGIMVPVNPRSRPSPPLPRCSTRRHLARATSSPSTSFTRAACRYRIVPSGLSVRPPASSSTSLTG
jgi:acyl-CoA synthetase (AMP-forming)/AMP-acid ligase II